MNYNMYNYLRLTGVLILYFLVIIISEAGFVTESTSAVLLLLMTILVVIYYSSNNLSDYGFFALLMTPYMSLNIVYMLNENVVYSKLSSVMLLGLIVFFTVYRQLVINSSSTSIHSGMMKVVIEGKILKCHFLIFVALILLKIISLIPSADLLYKAIKLMFGNVFVIVFYALLFAILSSSVKKSSIVVSLFMALVITFLNNYSVSSVSRFSFLQLALLVFFSFYARFNKSLSVDKYLFVFLISIVLFFSGYFIHSGLRFGGDSLIFKGAVDIIEYIDMSANYQPLMPFFNGGGILIPDGLWELIGDKPKAFNPSAFYIEHVMGLDPNQYPWGVGVSSFGAGYIYGGYLGVIFLFSMLAVVYAKFKNYACNPFSIGVVIYLNVLLVFAMIRMDESFIFGTWIVSIPVLFVFIKKFKTLFQELNN
ncbi:hypothetical protein [Vibrio parahaemolyticus]|uniref:hypothetical protein n=1 Tax=Vibrio parahaemolyticus TaxID=670 RepID=UPI0010374DE7|nr:hypothetical protein [Vibrio parahaemolyticus]EJG0778693.1 hypothetical protein [Vibrio parahaemolyticus]ELB2107528.1 hypothetical protein [Vibrio parahaemolyticus]MDA0388961.1 hypothetical protein [Vibrio parahaemolyticus]MDA0392875.1 hypothetical protein [Vibrio parahaemolyticus]MDA0398063.1 hypothetical protein [Vibrio parahaemolyticus]